jgi:hypothetical protein
MEYLWCGMSVVWTFQVQKDDVLATCPLLDCVYHMRCRLMSRNALPETKLMWDRRSYFGKRWRKARDQGEGMSSSGTLTLT